MPQRGVQEARPDAQWPGGYPPPAGPASRVRLLLLLRSLVFQWLA